MEKFIVQIIKMFYLLYSIFLWGLVFIAQLCYFIRFLDRVASKKKILIQRGTSKIITRDASRRMVVVIFLLFSFILFLHNTTRVQARAAATVATTLTTIFYVFTVLYLFLNSLISFSEFMNVSRMCLQCGNKIAETKANILTKNFFTFATKALRIVWSWVEMTLNTDCSILLNSSKQAQAPH